MASIQKTANGRYRARYRDSSGKEHLKRFALKREAQRWLDAETAKIETGTWVAPRTAKTTVGQWCDTWLRNYATRSAPPSARHRCTWTESKSSSDPDDSITSGRQRLTLGW